MRAVLGTACLGYVLWCPVSNGNILYPILLLLVIISASELIEIRRSRLTGAFAACIFLLGLAGTTGALLGSIRGNPGLSHQVAVWLGGLLVWALWASSLQRHRIRSTLTTITVMTSVLSVFILVYIASEQGHLPALIPSSWLEVQGAGIDLRGAAPAIRLFGLSTLAAAGPLAAAAWFAGRDPLLPPRGLLAVTGALAFVAALLSGRRAIAAVIVLSPLMTYGLMRALRPHREKQRPTINPRLAVAVPIACFVAVWGSSTVLGQRSLAALSDSAAIYLRVGTGSGAKPGNDLVRQQQADELLAAWGDRPLFGFGLGAVLPSEFTRSDARPWMFELQYHQLLFNLGLVGVALVALALMAGWRCIKRAARGHPEHVPTLVAVSVAALALLAANASNPYLQAVGHGWGLALAGGVANALLRGTDALEEKHACLGFTT